MPRRLAPIGGGMAPLGPSAGADLPGDQDRNGAGVVGHGVQVILTVAAGLVAAGPQGAMGFDARAMSQVIPSSAGTIWLSWTSLVNTVGCP